MLLTGGAPLLSLGVGTTGCGGDPPDGREDQISYQVTSMSCIKGEQEFLMILAKHNKE